MGTIGIVACYGESDKKRFPLGRPPLHELVEQRIGQSMDWTSVAPQFAALVVEKRARPKINLEAREDPFPRLLDGNFSQGLHVQDTVIF